MRSFLKYTGLILAFLAGLLAILILLSFLVNPKNNSQEAGMKDPTAVGFWGEPKNSIDVLVLGDSESYSSIIPTQMWQQQGITSKLLGGARDGLLRHNVQEEDIHVAWVPGAFEIPLVAAKMAKSGKYDAVICLGAVIRGATSHYDYVCSEVSKGIANVSLDSGVPVLFGVLTTENLEQAIERAGSKAGNKGYDCALSAIEMVNLLHTMEEA